MFDTLFAVRKGVTALDAMNQTSCFLETARDLAYEEQSYAVGCLIEMAKALVDAATKWPVENSEAITATSSVDAGKPGPTMENTDGGANRYDLVCALSGDITYLDNLLGVVDAHVGGGRDATLFSLLEAVIPRVKQALERVEKLELMG